MPDMGYDGNRTNEWIRKQMRFTGNRGWNVNAAIKQEYSDKKEKKTPTEDTTIRVELQEVIRKRLAQGCTKEQILAVLQDEPKFAKFSNFFESYIDNHLKKYDRER